MNFNEYVRQSCQTLMKLENNRILVPSCQLICEMKALFSMDALIYVLIICLAYKYIALISEAGTLNCEF